MGERRACIHLFLLRYSLNWLIEPITTKIAQSVVHTWQYNLSWIDSESNTNRHE